MAAKRSYLGLDASKFIAAFFVIAIHTSPLSNVSPEADFFLTRILGRTAVPLFLMVTGQFVLSDYLFKGRTSTSDILEYLRKIALLYGAAVLIYLPVGIYAGHYKNIGLMDVLRLLVFDGSFYHLWYFPACILGILLVCALCRFLSVRTALLLSILLYVIGLFGDSYYGLLTHVPALERAYETGFEFFSYTRNGLFLSPVFLLLGAVIGKKHRTLSPLLSGTGAFLALLAMTIEGFTLRHFSLQRHDSMYAALLPCMYFLYQLLLSWKLPRLKNTSFAHILRPLSTWIYILHPAMIVLVRGGARALRLTGVLVDNGMIHYLLVCITSLGASLGIAECMRHFRNTGYPLGRAWLELNSSALEQNVNSLLECLPPGCTLMPAVKADAYGHGAVLMAKELNRLGVNSFCVASVSEGAALRKKGIRGEILILGYTHPKELNQLRRYRLMQTVIDSSYAAQLNRYGKRLAVHVAVDTGMHRLGERSDHLTELYRIFRMKNLNVKGIFTHLCADDTTKPEDIAYTGLQTKAFFHVAEQLKSKGFRCPKLHLSASYGLLNYPRLPGDYARIGIALYGVFSTKEDTQDSWIPLRPVLSLKARVASVKELHTGESMGYGLTFTANREMKIATLSIGYADGLPRSLSNGVGEVLIHGHRAPVIGRICMDQTTVDVSEIPKVQTGDIAVLIGTSGEEEISACDLAAQAGTITNEILSRLGKRLERIMTE